MGIFYFNRRKASRGLYFGPPGWRPGTWQEVSQNLNAGLNSLVIPLPHSCDVKKAPQPGKSFAGGDILMSAENPGEAHAVSPATGICGKVLKLNESFLGIEFYPESFPTEFRTPTTVDPLSANTPSGLRAALQNLGIGATSPSIPSLLRQLLGLKERRARAIILNLLPAQPESALAHGISALAMPYLATGLNVVRNAVPHISSVVILDKYDRPTVRRWRVVVRRTGMTLWPALNTYPQANPTVLLRLLYGARLPVDTLPSDLDFIIVDPVTCWALGRFIKEREAFTARPVQFFAANQEPKLMLLPLGLRIEEFLNIRQIAGRQQQCIVNGMLGGQQVDVENAVVCGNTESFSVRPFPATESSSDCIRCGWCVDHCPTALNPAKLFYLPNQNSKPISPDADIHESLNCVGCGLCSYVCPSRLPLTEKIVTLRSICRQENDRGKIAEAPRA